MNKKNSEYRIRIQASSMSGGRLETRLLTLGVSKENNNA